MAERGTGKHLIFIGETGTVTGVARRHDRTAHTKKMVTA
jgi:hypothetical protein